MKNITEYTNQVETAILFPSLQGACEQVGRHGRMVVVGTMATVGQTLRDAGETLLASIKGEILAADPYFGMELDEKYAAIKADQARPDDGFDTSPCPAAERVELEGTDAEAARGMMERLTKLCGGDFEKAADYLEQKDRANSKWKKKQKN